MLAASAVQQLTDDRSAEESITTRCTSQHITQIDAAILVYFRVLFGLLMCWEMIRYLADGRLTLPFACHLVTGKA